MTGQKLAKASSSDCYKAFKQALVDAKRIEDHRRVREREGADMANTPQHLAPKAGTSSTLTEHSVLADGRNAGAAGGESTSRSSKAEPQTTTDRHISTAIVVTPHNLPATAVGAGAAGDRTGTTAVAPVKGVHIPPSPPSSPNHVRSPEAPAAAAAMASEPAASSERKLGTPSAQGQHSPVGGGGPATSVSFDVPVASLPAPAAPAIAMTSAPAGGPTGGVKAPEAVSGSARVSAPAPTKPPVKLGRGRKLCPSCHYKAKSAEKRCKQCGHNFSTASSRHRPHPREPKENEQAPMPARRRLRPNQRYMLADYELSEGGAGSGAGEEGQSGRAARRPLGAANASGGANRSVEARTGRTRPAAPTPKRLASGSPAAVSVGGRVDDASGAAGGDEGKSSADASAPHERHSHKRKDSVSAGAVRTPKRRKIPSASVLKAAGNEAFAVDTANRKPDGSVNNSQHSMLPLSSLQRIAQDLALMPSTVPSSPELLPPATPTGPAMFIRPEERLGLGQPAPLSDSSSSFAASPSLLHWTPPQPSSRTHSYQRRAAAPSDLFASEREMNAAGTSEEELLFKDDDHQGRGSLFEDVSWSSGERDFSAHTSCAVAPALTVASFSSVCLPATVATVGAGAGPGVGAGVGVGVGTAAPLATSSACSVPATDYSQRVLDLNENELLGDEGSPCLMWSPARSVSVGDGGVPSSGSFWRENSYSSAISNNNNNTAVVSRGSAPLAEDFASPALQRVSSFEFTGGGASVDSEWIASETVSDLHGLLMGDSSSDSLDNDHQR